VLRDTLVERIRVREILREPEAAGERVTEDDE
jgi:hypothetical protein